MTKSGVILYIEDVDLNPSLFFFHAPMLRHPLH